MTPDEAREAVVALSDRYHDVRPILGHILTRLTRLETGRMAEDGAEVHPLVEELLREGRLATAKLVTDAQAKAEQAETNRRWWQTEAEQAAAESLALRAEIERLTASLARAEAGELERTREGQAWKARAERAEAELVRLRDDFHETVEDLTRLARGDAP